MKVRARATVLEASGRRVLFHVEAADEIEKSPRAHKQFIVADFTPSSRAPSTSGLR